MFPNQFILSVDLNAFREYNVLAAHRGTQQVLALIFRYMRNQCTWNTIILAISILIFNIILIYEYVCKEFSAVNLIESIWLLGAEC